MAKKSQPSVGQNKIHKVMEEYKEGELKSSSGDKVTSRKQAVAIALSEARAAGAKVLLLRKSAEPSELIRLRQRCDYRLLISNDLRLASDAKEETGAKFFVPSPKRNLASILAARGREITDRWLELQAASAKRLSAAERQEGERKSRDLVAALTTAIADGHFDDYSHPQWRHAIEIVTDISAARALNGYSPSETATFVFSLKDPMFAVLREELKDDPEGFGVALLQASEILDKLGLATIEAYQKTRESIITRQQQELLELSTPVVQLWDNVLALPLIGTLDSARTQVVMQNLLEAIVQTRSDFAIIDITGVPVVDTLVAQHLLKTVAAARLMGADCLISGIRPQIAQTIIHLGVDLSNVTTKATLADAFAIALRRNGQSIVKSEKNSATGAK